MLTARNNSSLLLGITLIIGCTAGDHPEVGDVHGTVTLDGKPLSRATVVFEPVDGESKSSRATTDESGEYRLTYLAKKKGAVLGKHDVRITTATEHMPQEKLPDCYHRRSELTADVSRGSNVIDFKLDSRRGNASS